MDLNMVLLLVILAELTGSKAGRRPPSQAW